MGALGNSIGTVILPHETFSAPRWRRLIAISSEPISAARFVKTKPFSFSIGSLAVKFKVLRVRYSMCHLQLFEPAIFLRSYPARLSLTRPLGCHSRVIRYR